MKKVLFSDMDGTVIEFDQLLHPQDKLAIKKFRQQGNIVVFNTGRNEEEALKAMDYFGFDYDYLILNNGAQIIDSQGNELYKQVIPKNKGQEIINYCLQFEQLWLYFFDGKKTLANHQGITYHYNHQGQLEINQKEDFKTKVNEAKAFDIIAMHQDDRQIDKLLTIQQHILDHYQDVASATLNTFYLDITPANCSKGTGISKLLQLLNQDVISYAIGDSYNDLSMFPYVDYSATFNHVAAAIKKQTQIQVASVAKLIQIMEEDK